MVSREVDVSAGGVPKKAGRIQIGIQGQGPWEASPRIYFLEMGTGITAGGETI
jgi:hypothetical protein